MLRVLVPLVLGMVVALGAAHWIFGELNILTGFLGAILLGLGVDYGIHLVSKLSGLRSSMNAREALVVPRDALVLRPEGISVFVLDQDRKAKQVNVAIGIGSGQLIEVSGELQDGDTVITRGNERLRPGQAVSIMQ